MRGLPSFLSMFCYEFNKFNNTGARNLDSIYHYYDIKFTLKHIFGVEKLRYCARLCYGRYFT